MLPTGLHEFYYGCMSIGFLYVAGSLAMGGLHAHSAAGHTASHGANSAHGSSHAGHGNSGHAGHGNSGHAGHGNSGHAGHGNSGHAGHGNSGHAGHSNSSHAGHSSSHSGHSSSHSGHSNSSSAHTAHGQGSAGEGAEAEALQLNSNRLVQPASARNQDCLERSFFLALRIFNPMSIAMFLFFFGLTGALILTRMPCCNAVSLAPASLAAVFLSAQMQNLMGWIAGRLDTTSSFSLQDAAGALGEMTVSAPAGRVGEAMFTIGGARRCYAARSADDEPLPRGTKVVFIAKENHIVLVERFNRSDV